MSKSSPVPPILILAFNRPKYLHKLISSLRVIKPPIVYCAQDGPRIEKKDDLELCNQVTALWNKIDWPCEKHTLIRKHHLGCQKGVSEAITWFFRHEISGIILEDDCLPDPSFYLFCEQLLHQYKDDLRIMHISGNTFCPQQYIHPLFKEKSYRFSRYPHCWGWATWKRAWDYFDVSLEQWPTLKSEKWIESFFSNPLSQSYWINIFSKIYDKKIDSWALPWVYSCWVNNGLSILPNRNLVSNIGFDTTSTHTTNSHSPFAHLKTYGLTFPISHPNTVMRDYLSDRFDQSYVYLQLTPKLLLQRLKKIHSFF